MTCTTAVENSSELTVLKEGSLAVQCALVPWVRSPDGRRGRSKRTRRQGQAATASVAACGLTQGLTRKNYSHHVTPCIRDPEIDRITKNCILEIYHFHLSFVQSYLGLWQSVNKPLIFTSTVSSMFSPRIQVDYFFAKDTRYFPLFLLFTT